MNILIGSNGGFSGVYLAKQFKKISGLRILGADSSDDTVGRFFVDKQLKLPPASDTGFVGELIRVLNKEKIDIYIPTHSKETHSVSQNENEIRSNTKAKFIVSPKETYDALENKKEATHSLLEIGIPTPSLITDFNCEYPIIMKEDISSGSKGIIVIDNALIHKAYMDTHNNCSFYEIVHGDEFTVDCMFDYSGNLLGLNQRKRVRVSGGAVSITRNSCQYDIRPYIEKIAAAWKFCGCVNFQYILHDTTPYFIDINLRFPAGGLPLTVESGLDIPKMVLDIVLGNNIESFSLQDDKKNLSMYRYYEEIFER